MMILEIWFFAAIKYTSIAGGAYLVFWKLFPQKFRRFRIHQKERQLPRPWFEFQYSMITVVIQSLLLYLLYLGAQHGIFDVYSGFLSRGWSPVIQGVVVHFLVYDCHFYFTHRLFHTPWLYRHIHIIHHRSLNPTPWATYSFHPLEALSNFSYIFLVVWITPFSWELLVAILILTDLGNIGGHLGYDLVPRKAWSAWWGRWLTTPTHHHMHHIYPHFNFGLYWRSWDHYLKTLHPKTESEFYRVKDQK
jgi:sterol desaturase/sphingolipid hydroxylase (fatty acid hydroxylase superfamily)